jgi:hypothetical protein
MLLSGRRASAEEALRTAISSLQCAIAKDTKHAFPDLPFPPLSDGLSVEDSAGFVTSAILNVLDSIAIQARARGFLSRTKKAVEKWIKAAIPFTQVFLNVAKLGSAVRCQFTTPLTFIDSDPKPIWPCLWSSPCISECNHMASSVTY